MIEITIRKGDKVIVRHKMLNVIQAGYKFEGIDGLTIEVLVGKEEDDVPEEGKQQ